MKNVLDGKVVVVAGGSSGMGRALAAKAAAEGAEVHLIGRSSLKLSAAVNSIDGHVVPHLANISLEPEMQALSNEIPRVDHLITTAAHLVFKPFLDLTDEDILRMLESKFWGPTYLVRHFAPKMSKDGSITFFSGSAAYKGWAGASIVASLNAGLDGFARTLALELAPVRVNVVSPGVVDTATWDFLKPDVRVRTLEAIGSSLPTGRVGTADELADSALFLMKNGFTTGTIMQVDGGANA